MNNVAYSVMGFCFDADKYDFVPITHSDQKATIDLDRNVKLGCLLDK